MLVQLDGKQLPMKDFVEDFVLGGITGMLSSLRGWEKPRDDYHPYPDGGG